VDAGCLFPTASAWTPADLAADDVGAVETRGGAACHCLPERLGTSEDCDYLNSGQTVYVALASIDTRMLLQGRYDWHRRIALLVDDGDSYNVVVDFDSVACIGSVVGSGFGSVDVGFDVVVANVTVRRQEVRSACDDFQEKVVQTVVSLILNLQVPSEVS
jgi:hypothetical protein